MDYLTYPFHDPELVRLPSTHPEGRSATDESDPEASTEQLATPDPLVLSSSASSSISSAISTSFTPLSSSVDTRPSLFRTPSDTSCSSSQRFIQHHNAAFAKIRTANGVPGVEGPTRDIPEEWKDFHPPSLAAGHWMSFGPTEAVLTVADRPQTASSYGNAKKELEHGKSSLWKGTIWLTETNLIFILNKNSIPEKADLHEHGSHTEHWVASIRRMLGHGHRRNSGDEEDTHAAVMTADPETGYPITAFQVPLSKLKKVSLKKPSKHGSKRNSIASSSQGFRSPPGSNTISPALSRIQTRNNKDARSPSSRPGHLGENATATPRSSSPAPPLVTETQPFDFGELINRKEDPMIVRIISEDQQKVAKVDLRFMSVLYQDEARALADRLRGSVRR